jgi:4-hydroxybenzoate polyprenyltransferase
MIASTSDVPNISAKSTGALSLLLDAIRIKHWIKNLFIFAPLIFSENFLNPVLLQKSIIAFLAFSSAASSVYLFNDLFDRENDQRHPAKRLRPIASGRLKIAHARMLAIAFLLVSVALSLIVNVEFTLITAAYLVLNIVYTLELKRVVILDVLVLALFYVIRVSGGGYAIGVHVSNWLLICTLFLALLMGFGKRRHELVLLKENAKEHRGILADYSPYFLDQMIAVVTPSTLVVYSMYTLSQETIAKFQTNKLPLTIPLVLYGIFRYLYLVHQKEEGGNPTQLMLTDKPLILTVLGWVAAVLVILYIK